MTGGKKEELFSKDGKKFPTFSCVIAPAPPPPTQTHREEINQWGPAQGMGGGGGGGGSVGRREGGGEEVGGVWG